MAQFQTNRSDLQIELFEQLSDKFVKPQMADRVSQSTELGDLLRAALKHPLHYPPLAESVFPGDRVAIVVQSGLPHPQSVLGLLIEQLLEIQIQLSEVVVVINRQLAQQFGFSKQQIETATDPETQTEPATLVHNLGSHEIQFQIHNGANQASLAYLAANEAGEPMHLNRFLVDADVVLPLEYSVPGGTEKPITCLYPEYGSRDVQSRFAKEDGSAKSRWEEIRLAQVTLGSFYTIQLVTGPGDSIQQIVSGVRPDATAMARVETKKLWEFEWPKDIEITLATIESTVDAPGWEDFAAAVIAASRVSIANGPIIVWSEISDRPSSRIGNALISQFDDAGSNKMPKRWRQVVSLLQERPIYLRSQLSRNMVEELGIGYLDSATEINRIAESWKTGLLMRDAHKYQFESADSANSDRE